MPRSVNLCVTLIFLSDNFYYISPSTKLDFLLMSRFVQVIANRLAMEGADVILAGKMSKSLRDKIRSGIKLTGNGLETTSEKDDIHLIMEYKRNEEWGKYKSPRANR